VGRHENDAPATPQTFKVIFESVMNDEPADVAFVQFGHVSELHEQSSEIFETSSKNFFPRAAGKLWKCHLQVAKTSATLSACEMKPKPGQRLSSWVCNPARHRGKESNYEQCERVFGDAFNACAHRDIFAYFA